jgi:amidophosphoribosyltransferase
MCHEFDKHWRDECGVFGIYLQDSSGPNEAARDTFFGLYALQHRGQESAGIAVSNGQEIVLHKAMGLVSEVFSPDVLKGLMGNLAIGHVRYSTTGSSHAVNAQPLVFRYLKGMIALAHNGNLVNAGELRLRLANFGSVFQTTTDTEIIVNLLARYGRDSLENALAKSMIDIKGAYALIIMTENKLIGMRDPLGIRPLCLGKREDGYLLASESCAFYTVGAVSPPIRAQPACLQPSATPFTISWTLSGISFPTAR